MLSLSAGVLPRYHTPHALQTSLPLRLEVLKQQRLEAHRLLGVRQHRRLPRQPCAVVVLVTDPPPVSLEDQEQLTRRQLPEQMIVETERGPQLDQCGPVESLRFGGRLESAKGPVGASPGCTMAASKALPNSLAAAT